MAKEKNSSTPLAYIGVNPITPPQMLHHPFPPKANDRYNVDLGAFWIDTVAKNLYTLMGISGGAADWKLIGGDDVAGSAGGVIEVTYVDGVSTVSLTNGANGQLLIGGGAAPVWANLASAGGTVNIANTANGINLEATGVAGLTSLATDLGIAFPVLGSILVHGGTNITTSAIGPLLTISMTDDIAITNIDITNQLTLSGEVAGVLVTDVAGNVSAANGTDGQLLFARTGLSPEWGSFGLGVNDQTGTSYTLVLTDSYKIVTVDNAATITLTVPANALVAFPIGTQVFFEQKGAGEIYFTAGSGVTIESRDTRLNSNGQYSVQKLVKTAANTWALYGDLKA